jgi:N-acetyl-anhydromuramyl-L-alanine amidase AmpD
MRDVKDRPRPEPEALVVHTTGRGVYDLAKKLNKPVIEAVLGEYQDPESNFAHYVIDLDGVLWQVANETEMAWHCRVSPQEAASYRDGSWRKGLSPAGLAAWDRAHGPANNPAGLLRTGSPNQVGVGVELVPLQGIDSTGSLYTEAQYRTVAALVADIQRRWLISGLPVFGHEDLSPLSRWGGGGGWDPGALRAAPWFDWSRV